MSKKSSETASFIVRFNQKLFENENGQPDIQWRGKISHIQGGDQVSFTDFEEALSFMQNKLSGVTLESIQDKSAEEKKGILGRSFKIWKQVAATYPKLVMDAIKDPKGQVTQIQEQISSVGDEISQKVEFDAWRAASKKDYKEMMKTISKLTKEVSSLTKKVDKLAKKK